jgi:uncharacterized membrane protein
MTSGSTVATSSAPARDSSPLQIVISPNCSLTPRTATLFLCATGGHLPHRRLHGATRACGPSFRLRASEVALLVWATMHCIRRGRAREIVEIDRNSVSVELIKGSHRQITVFPRHWTKVKLRAPLQGLHPSRLTLESQGRTCEVGSLTGRFSLAKRLKQLVGNA